MVFEQKDSVCSLALKRPAWAFIRQRKRQSLMIVFFGMVTQLLTMMIPISIGKYYQLAFGQSGRRVQFMDFIPATWWDTVPQFLIFFMSLVACRYVFFFVYQYTLNQEGQHFTKTIKDNLFSHQLNVHYPIYREKGVGKYLLRYSGDLNSLRNVYVRGSLSVISDVFIVSLAFVWFFHLSPAGALVILVGSLAAYTMIFWMNQRVECYSMKKRDKTAGQLAFVSRTLQGILAVTLMNKEATELKKYRKRSANIVASAADYNRWLVANNGFIAFLQYSVLAVVLYLFYRDQEQGNTTLNGAYLTSFILLYLTVLPVIRRLFRLPTIYKLGHVSLTKLQNIYQLPIEDKKSGIAFTANATAVQLHFKQVQFAEGQVSVETINPQHYLIQRPKTLAPETIFQALTRLNHPDDYTGSITINDRNINTYNAESLRTHMSFISEKVPLLGRSVYEAITLSRSKQSAKHAQHYLEKIQAALSIPANARLSLQDKTGENGSSLSAMQYQVLCLVRGLNTTKPILLCDALPLIAETTYLSLLDKEGKTIIRCV